MQVNEQPEELRDRFHRAWTDPDNPRYDDYRRATNPKLWACRCLEGREWIRTIRLGGNPILRNAWLIPLKLRLCRRFVERYEVVAFCGSGSE